MNYVGEEGGRQGEEYLHYWAGHFSIHGLKIRIIGIQSKACEK